MGYIVAIDRLALGNIVGISCIKPMSIDRFSIYNLFFLTEDHSPTNEQV